MSVEETREVEKNLPGDNVSVETPLVDALQKWFFKVEEAVERQPSLHR